MEPYFESNETLQHLFEGSGGVVHEHDGKTEKTPVPADGGSLCVVTDHGIYVAVRAASDETVIAVPYRDVRDVDVDAGLLRSTFSVRVWTEGTYRLKTKETETLTAAIAYCQEAIDCWQYVLPKLDTVRDGLPELNEHIADGRLGEARTQREKLREVLDSAQRRIEQADIESIPELQDRVESTREHLARTEIQARMRRISTLRTEATHMTDSRAYTGALERYWQARDHLETARMLARKANVESPVSIDEELETIEIRIENLRMLPLALAKQARQRAEMTNDLETRVRNLERAFEHYRDALVVGWGSDFEFAGDPVHLRFQIEVVADELVESRTELAKEFLERGEAVREDDDGMPAEHERRIEQWDERARNQLDEAAQLAREFRSPSVEAVSAQRARLEERIAESDAERQGDW